MRLPPWRRRERTARRTGGADDCRCAASCRPSDAMRPGMMTTPARGNYLDSGGVHRATASATVRAVSSTAVATPSDPVPAGAGRGRTGRRTARGRCSWAVARRRKDRPAACQHVLVDGSLSRDHPVTIVGAPLIDHARNGVDHGDARPGIEGEDAILLGAPHDVGEVGHPAEVEQHPRRVRRGKRSTSAIGTSGAPCPPAATSRARKPLTTLTPNLSANTAGSPSCQEPAVARARWSARGKAINESSEADTLPCTSTVCTASAAHSATRTCSRAREGAVAPLNACADLRSFVVGIGTGHEVEQRAWVGPSSRTRAASTPSSEVPDISPIASVGRSVISTALVEGLRRLPAAARHARPAAARPHPSAPHGEPSRSPSSRCHPPLR